MQLSKESEGGVYRSVVIMEHTLSLMNVSKEEPSFKLVRLNQQAYRKKISQVLECQGLLLCILEEGTRFVLWNPYLGQTRWIEPRYCYHGNLPGDRFTYALGYADNNKTSSSSSSSSSSCCRSHKILRLLDDYVPPLGSDYYFGKHFVWYEIYDVDSGQWTTLDYKTTRPEFPITTSGFFLDEEKKIAIRFDEKSKWASDRHILSIGGENGLYNRELDLGERLDKQDRVSQLCCYVPSLVQIKQLVLGKRKRLDVIEKRKYDERMMRLVQLLKPIVGKGSSKRTRRR